MTQTKPAQRVIILGALSAIAEAYARRLASEGASLVLLARDSAKLESVAADLRVRGASQVVTKIVDLATMGQAERVVVESAQALGGCDVIALFYGTLGDQAKAEVDWDTARTILDVNFSSAAEWMLAGANQLERTPSSNAVLIAVSSVAGDRGRRSNYVYGAAKGGLSILMQGIAHRFAKRPAGPRAVVMKLGFVDTPMTAGIAKGGPLWATADQAAEAIFRATLRGGPIVYAPLFWRFVMLAIRLTPSAVFNKVNL